MPTYRTPDVYIEEISVFPPSVAEVETAIPAFIGYTEKATRTVAGDLLMKPAKIYSLKEYEQLFGGPQVDTIGVAVTNTSGVYTVGTITEPTVRYILYFAVKMFFDNGGGKCYIVSVGGYSDTISLGAGTTGLQGGLNALALEDEPTLIVIPEAVRLSRVDYQSLVQSVLAQCESLKDRFGIFDLFDGTLDQDLTPSGQASTVLPLDRGYFGNNSNLKYGAVYYPFVRSSMNFVVDETTANLEKNVVLAITGTEAGTATLADLRTGRVAAAAVLAVVAAPAVLAGPGGVPPAAPAVAAAPAVLAITAVTVNTEAYNLVKTALKDHYVVMPPSGAVAGVYAATDTNRGVWKAPANVSLADVIEPVILLNNAKQDSLNIDATSGKSINAIRAFVGKGTLVWGARTLAGNDNEWRYVNVRRFFNMVEESVKKSTHWAVFEPNTANTWVKVRGMIENYLTQKWREGALAGATTKDAFFVRCGLGTTMTAQDILEGRMNVEIGMAAVRPAEFIILKFSHKLQTS